MAAAVSWTVGPVANAQATGGLAVTDTLTTYAVTDGTATVTVQKAPWRLSLAGIAGTAAMEQDPALPDLTSNAAAQSNKNVDGMGHDKAYPGLPVVSTRPLAYLRGGAWQHVTPFASAVVSGGTVTITAATSDGLGATVTLVFRGPAVDLRFNPSGAAADAVAESFTQGPGEHYYGGGGRFLRPELTGLSVPLWASHGIGADRYTFTNEIAVPFLVSTGGWGLWDRTGARGELAVGVPDRPGVLSAILETNALYVGGMQPVLSAFTVDSGRNPVPPEWAFRPMFWDDNHNDQAFITAAVDRLRADGFPVGAYWIDNPFQPHQGDFAPSPTRFPDFAGFVAGLHAQGVRLMTWVSPFISPGSIVESLGAKAVAGMPADHDDHTYVPARSLTDHVDLTDPASYAAEVAAATALLERGVDGFKLDRGEEDYADAAVFADGSPNRLEHNRYAVQYDTAMREACTRAHPDGDCFLIARGGAAGSAHQVAQWAGDSVASEGSPGLGAAVHAQLAQALSGQPIFGSDIGGHGGRQDGSIPTAGTFVRWAQFGALSPSFETPNHPYDYDAQTEAAIRSAAVLHDRLAPYSHAYAQQAADTGLPIVRPLVLAYPGDAVATTVDDEYLYRPDLLVAPFTTGVSAETAAARSVYFPAGGWTNVFTGAHVIGPTTQSVTSPYDEFPLFARDGGAIPMSTFANLDATATPALPEAPLPVVLPLAAAGLLLTAVEPTTAPSAPATRSPPTRCSAGPSAAAAGLPRC